MVGLRPPSHHRRQGVTDGEDVPAPDARTFFELHPDDLAGFGHERFITPVEVDVQQLRARRRGIHVLSGHLGGIVGRDQVGEGRQSHMGEVDAAEDAVPVAVVRLALVQVVEGRRPGRAFAHCRDLLGRQEHLLVKVVHLPVLHLEVAPEAAPQPARLGTVSRHVAVEHLGELPRFLGRQRPLAHLRVRRSRDVNPTDRRLPLQPRRRRDRRQPIAAGLQGMEEAVDPPALPPRMRVGRRPATELLAIIAHDADTLALVGGVVLQIADDVRHVLPRDRVPEVLLAAEDGQQTALILGRVRTPQVLFRDGCGAEVRVVEDRPAVSGGRQ